MSIYILNYFALLLWSFVKNRNVQVVIVGVQLFLILALRSESLGVDLEQYKLAYEYYARFSLIDVLSSFHLFLRSDLALGSECGYVFINWLFGHFGVSFHSFLVIHSLICVCALCVFIRRYSSVPWMSFAIFIALGFYGSMFCILRQSLAVVFLYMSFFFVEKRKIMFFLATVYVASLFHSVAFLFVPFYWIAPLFVSMRKICVGLVGALMVVLLTPLIYRYVISNVFLSFGKEYVMESVFTYNNMIVFSLFIVLFVACFYLEDIQSDKRNTMLFWGAFMGIPVQVLGFYIPIISRASIGIFFPLLGILIPNLIAQNKEIKNHFFPYLLLFVLFFVYYLVMFTSSGLRLNPYIMHSFS